MTGVGIVARCQDLERQVEALGQLRAASNEAEAFRTRADQLSKLAERLKSLVECVQVFRARGIEPAVSDGQVAELLETTRTQRQAFTADPNSLISDQQDSSFKWAYLETAERLANLLKRELERAWEREIASLRPESLSNELVEMFSRIQAFKPKVELARTSDLELQTLAGEVPQSVEGIDRAREVATQLAEHWHSVAGTDVPEPVQAFLAAAVGPGASLDGFDDEIREWFESQGLLGAVRVVLR